MQADAQHEEHEDSPDAREATWTQKARFNAAPGKDIAHQMHGDGALSSAIESGLDVRHQVHEDSLNAREVTWSQKARCKATSGEDFAHQMSGYLAGLPILTNKLQYNDLKMRSQQRQHLVGDDVPFEKALAKDTRCRGGGQNLRSYDRIAECKGGGQNPRIYDSICSWGALRL